MSEQDPSHDRALEEFAARLEKAVPGGASELKAKVFYQAGYQAGNQAALKQRDGAFRPYSLAIAAACLLIAVGAGVILGRASIGSASSDASLLAISNAKVKPAPPDLTDASRQVDEGSTATPDTKNSTRAVASDSAALVPNQLIGNMLTGYLDNWTRSNALKSRYDSILDSNGRIKEQRLVTKTPAAALTPLPPPFEFAPRRPPELNPLRRLYFY